MLLVLSLTAQTKKITGVIRDVSGQPLIGVAIYEIGNLSNGTTSTLDGKFSINIKPNGSFNVSYIGYQPQIIAIGNETNFNVSLNDDVAAIDEVVVIGYGTQKRSSMSSSVASVSAKEVSKQIVPNVASALQGRAAGVDVVQQGGIAGADVSIVIRGAASLTGT